MSNPNSAPVSEDASCDIRRIAGASAGLMAVRRPGVVVPLRLWAPPPPLLPLPPPSVPPPAPAERAPSAAASAPGGSMVTSAAHLAGTAPDPPPEACRHDCGAFLVPVLLYFYEQARADGNSHGWALFQHQRADRGAGASTQTERCSHTSSRQRRQRHTHSTHLVHDAHVSSTLRRVSFVAVCATMANSASKPPAAQHTASPHVRHGERARQAATRDCSLSPPGTPQHSTPGIADVSSARRDCTSGSTGTSACSPMRLQSTAACTHTRQ
jgi:hypothetical protein